MRRKVIILGAGAVGSLVGALLSEVHDVTLIGRKKHVNVITKKGLCVTGLISKSFRLCARTSIGKIDPGTVIFLTTKLGDIDKTVRSITNKLLPDTKIVCMQNGIDAASIVKKIVSNQVVTVAQWIAVEFLNAGEIKYIYPLKLAVDEKEIVDVFEGTGVDVTYSKSVRQKQWEKLVLNCVANPLSALLDIECGKLYNGDLRQVVDDIIDECTLVGRKEGIRFNKAFLENIHRILQTSMQKSSTWQDLHHGRKTEIDFLNGSVVRLGKTYKIPTPLNELLVSMIHFLEMKKGNGRE